MVIRSNLRVDYSSNKDAILYKGRVIRYPELLTKVARVKNIIDKISIKKGVLVGIYFDKCPDMIVTILALVEKEIAFLPIMLNSPINRLKSILNNSEINVILTNTKNYEKLNKVIEESNFFIVDIDSNKHMVSYINSPIYANDIAYAMYTSGSTGTPKGVLVKRSSMFNLFAGLIEAIKINRDDTFICLTNYTFDVSLVEILLPFYVGASVYLADDNTILNVEEIKKILKFGKISVMQATPTTWHLLISSGWRNTDPSLKILSGGEVLSNVLLKSLNPTLGNIWNVYGPTETTMWSSIYHANQISNNTLSTPIGKALKHQNLHVLDESLVSAELNSSGELYIGGLGVAHGYINDNKLTSEKFINLPKLGLVYRTGDMVRYLCDGNIEYIGRNDCQIKIGGIRIEIGEIEACVEKLNFIKKIVVLSGFTYDKLNRIFAFIDIDEESLEEKNHINYVDNWKNIYNSAYRDIYNYRDLSLNPSAWVNSFTQKYFSDKELKENIDFLIKKINRLNHNVIYEDGCGAGNLISALYENVSSYTAAEISETVLTFLNEKFEKVENVQIIKKHAHENIDESKYDCILMNSIIQYFPSFKYLFNFIENRIKSIRANGTIVIGDVRHKDLLDYLIIDKYIDKKNSNWEDLYLKSRESELLVSPQFFLMLKRYFQRVSHVDINLKAGESTNELNYYRYDVFIHIDKTIEYIDAEIYTWSSICEDPIKKTYILLKNSNNPIIIKNFPNPLAKRILGKEKSITNSHLKRFLFVLIRDFSEIKDIKYVKSFLKWVLSLNHDVYINYDEKTPFLYLRIEIYPRESNKIIRSNPKFLDEHYEKIDSYVRNPFSLNFYYHILNNIRNHVQSYLPCYMHPINYYWIEKWPITTNGKIDKKALQFNYQSKNLDVGIDSLEHSLVKMWETITCQVIDAKKNFGTLGVSSIYFYYFISELNKKFNINIMFMDIKPDLNIEKLAKLIQKSKLFSKQDSMNYNLEYET